MLLEVVCGLFYVVAHAPKGTVTAQSDVRNIYAGGADRFSRCEVGNLLPEVDQIMLGLTLIPAIDPLFTQLQASKLKTWTAAIYQELDADESFHECGSAMPFVYDELLGSDDAVGHAFLYIPPKLDRTKPAPTLIFLHGSGGNFKAYLWLLSRLANRLNFAVLAPSYGMGYWSSRETSKVVDGAIAAAGKHMAIARDSIHVMGLSNGGLGVCQLARDSGARFRSMIFLSPVFDDESIQSHAFARECQQSKIFVLTGVLDDRVPINYVREHTETIALCGAKVTFETEDKADHFLFFSHKDRVLASIEKWLRTTQ